MGLTTTTVFLRKMKLKGSVNRFLGRSPTIVEPFFISRCGGVLASTSGSHKMESTTHRVKVKERVWSQRLPFKCEETVLCGISMHFLALSSVCLPLPVTPTATITCHPRLSLGRLSLSLPSLSNLPVHSPFAHPRMSPVILFIRLLLGPFCRGFPPIQVHTSQVSARPCAPLPSLGAVAVVTGGMDDGQLLAPLNSTSALWNTTHTSETGRPLTNPMPLQRHSGTHTRIISRTIISWKHQENLFWCLPLCSLAVYTTL